MSTFNGCLNSFNEYCLDSLASLPCTENKEMCITKVKSSSNPFLSILSSDVSPKSSFEFSVCRSMVHMPNFEITSLLSADARYPNSRFPTPSKQSFDYASTNQSTSNEQSNDMQTCLDLFPRGGTQDNSSLLYFGSLANENKEENKLLKILSHEMNIASPMVSDVSRMFFEQKLILEKSVKWPDYLLYHIFGIDRTGYFEIQEKIQQIQQSSWCVFDKDFWSGCANDTGSVNFSVVSRSSKCSKSYGKSSNDGKSHGHNNQNSLGENFAQSIDIISVGSCNSGDFCSQVFERV
ncbi:hypothetical protein ACO0QE_002796 [Hanseniaspora vineae]